MKRALGALALALAGNGTAGAAAVGSADFVDRRDPPPYRELSAAQREAFDLGHAIFNTQWVPADTPRAQRRDGLGPLFNAATCDACHNEGARGQALAEGAAPASLVIQLAAADGVDAGDPVYGRTLNTSALDGVPPEATVHVRYSERSGQHGDGRTWTLRVPEYDLGTLAYGPLAAGTVIKPRIAPALFGAGLLEAVPAAAVKRASERNGGRIAWRMYEGRRSVGRFGWQGDAVSIEDQTARAFAREMGLTSRSQAHDDCSESQPACRAAASGGDPEVSDEFMSALVAFQQALAVPRSATTGDRAAEALFTSTGCAGCHLPRLPVGTGKTADTIAAYTDLLLHDLGPALADHRVDGSPVQSLWRTAPLWGLGHAAQRGPTLALMHDGRARSVEEAVLWHDGEAASARTRFSRLDEGKRRKLLAWVESR